MGRVSLENVCPLGIVVRLSFGITEWGATTGSRSTIRRELATAASNGVAVKLFGFENEYMFATPLAVEEQCIRYRGPAKKKSVCIFVTTTTRVQSSAIGTEALPKKNQYALLSQPQHV
jgi:hypothetical protein